MPIVDDLIENLVERNAVDLNGTFTISLVDGGLRIRGHVLSTLRDDKKKKDLATIDAPLDAQVTVGEIVIPIPQIK
jgi:hypothetical protein